MPGTAAQELPTAMRDQARRARPTDRVATQTVPWETLDAAILDFGTKLVAVR